MNGRQGGAFHAVHLKPQAAAASSAINSPPRANSRQAVLRVFHRGGPHRIDPRTPQNLIFIQKEVV